MVLALSLLWLLIVYISKVIVSYHLVSWGGTALRPRWSAWLDVAALMIGTLLYTLLRSLPYVGWVIAVLVVALGMGSVWATYRPSRPHVPTRRPTEPASAAGSGRGRT